jgi:hypothetical protein
MRCIPWIRTGKHWHLDKAGVCDIDIDVSKLARNQETGLSEKQIAFGKIFYPANRVQSQETGEII